MKKRFTIMRNLPSLKKLILLIIFSLFLYSIFIIVNKAHYSLEVSSLSTQYRNYQYRPPVLFQLINKYIIKISIYFISILYILKIYNLYFNTYNYYRICRLVSFIAKKKYLFILPKFNESEYKIPFLLK